ncbi:MAG: FAD-binding protein, partial [Flavobacterium sp.]
MKKEIEIAVSPQVAFTPELLDKEILNLAGIQAENEVFVHKLKRSVDARGREVLVRVKADIYLSPPPISVTGFAVDYKQVQDKKAVVIIGAGSAGLFAALRCIELGYKPIVLERGKDVKSRRRDLAAINKEHIVNPESNYCFGEGGAGTYSDGKLYTRSKKRGDVQRILHLLVHHGATPEILFDAHPHIGTNKLPVLISAIRKQIIDCGGEVRFDTKVTDFVIKNNEVKAVIAASGDEIDAEAFVLATGRAVGAD